MIEAPTSSPVFRYAFRPLACRQYPDDGGFSVTLFTNDTLAFNVVDIYKRSRLLMWFQVSPDVKKDYFALLDHADWWLFQVPTVMREDGQVQFTSMFGFDTHQALVVDDLPLLSQRPYGDPVGRYARHLFALHEDISDMLLHHGFQMQLDGFSWDTRVVAPVPRPNASEDFVPGAVNY